MEDDVFPDVRRRHIRQMQERVKRGNGRGGEGSGTRPRTSVSLSMRPCCMICTACSRAALEVASIVAAETDSSPSSEDTGSLDFPMVSMTASM